MLFGIKNINSTTDSSLFFLIYTSYHICQHIAFFVYVKVTHSQSTNTIHENLYIKGILTFSQLLLSLLTCHSAPLHYLWLLSLPYYFPLLNFNSEYLSGNILNIFLFRLFDLIVEGYLGETRWTGEGPLSLPVVLFNPFLIFLVFQRVKKSLYLSISFF